METVQERLKLIREGVILEDAGESDDFIMESLEMDLSLDQSYMLEAFVVAESSELSIAEMFLEAANAEDSNKVVKVFREIKERTKTLLMHFDPYAGLKELRLINTLMADDRLKKQLSSIGGATGGFVAHKQDASLRDQQLAKMGGSLAGVGAALIAKSVKYKKMDKSLIESYIKEAGAFKDNLEKIIKVTQGKTDKDTKRLNYRTKLTLGRLNGHITTFKMNAKA
jgi:hypothetical protein